MPKTVGRCSPRGLRPFRHHLRAAPAVPGPSLDRNGMAMPVIAGKNGIEQKQVLSLTRSIESTERLGPFHTKPCSRKSAVRSLPRIQSLPDYHALTAQKFHRSTVTYPDSSASGWNNACDDVDANTVRIDNGEMAVAPGFVAERDDDRPNGEDGCG